MKFKKSLSKVLIAILSALLISTTTYSEKTFAATEANYNTSATSNTAKAATKSTRKRTALVLGETSTAAVPEKDVTSMTAMFKNNNIAVSSYQNLSKSKITSLLKSTFANSTSNDVNYVYMTCHGDSTGRIYIPSYGSYTGAELKSILDTTKGTVVLMLDCCYAGSIINKSAGEFNAQNFLSSFYSTNSNTKSGELVTSKYKVLCSSSKTETSNGGSLSLATKYWELGAGWDPINNCATTMKADANNNNSVTVHELYKYSYNNALYYQTVVCYPSSSTFVLFSK